MNNQELIEKLTKGTKHTEEVEINGDTFTMRPLTSGELSKIQSIEKKGFKMQIGVNAQGKRQSVRTNDVDVNVGEFSEYQNEAMYTAIALSLSIGNVNIRVDQVKELPTNVPEELFEHVIRISKLSDKDLTIIKNFRKE